MDQFIDNILSGKKSKRSVVDQLYKMPVRDKNGDNPTIPIIKPNYAQYMDLLYLPNDNGKKYCLVIVDQGSRYVGAWALEDREVSDIIRGMRIIYNKSKDLKIPYLIITDNGSEFKGNFDAKILTEFNIKHHKFIKAGRHRQMLAERKNQTIGKIISRILTQVQLSSGNPSSKWVSYLPTIIDKINDKVYDRDLKPISIDDSQPVTSNPNHKIDLLNVGDEVRVMLDNPMDVNKNKLHGKFRTGDIRWNPEIRHIKYLFTKPNQPIMYFLDGKQLMQGQYVEPVGYTRNQLQKVSTREIDPDEQLPLFDNEFDREEIQNINERGVNDDGKTMYKVKFKQIRNSVWIDRENLVKDLGNSFMNKLDEKFNRNMPQ